MKNTRAGSFGISSQLEQSGEVLMIFCMAREEQGEIIIDLLMISLKSVPDGREGINLIIERHCCEWSQRWSHLPIGFSLSLFSHLL